MGFLSQCSNRKDVQETENVKNGQNTLVIGPSEYIQHRSLRLSDDGQKY